MSTQPPRRRINRDKPQGPDPIPVPIPKPKPKPVPASAPVPVPVKKPCIVPPLYPVKVENPLVEELKRRLAQDRQQAPDPEKDMQEPEGIFKPLGSYVSSNAREALSMNDESLWETVGSNRSILPQNNTIFF